MDQDVAKTTVEMAAATVEFMVERGEPWDCAYYRYVETDALWGSNGSFRHGGRVTLFSVSRDGSYLDAMNDVSRQVLEHLGKKRAVLLLTVGVDMTYKLDFEFDDMDRWKISRAEGRTGIPGE
jgi:hypothetical protein